MAKCYFELRKQSARGTDSVAADIMRHMHTRQHIGKAVVICEQPTALHAAARKQWLKLSRLIQKQRASTLNADKILKYTHTITHMQHMHFTTKTPLDDPEADVYFLDKTSCGTMPLHCYSLYFTIALDEETTTEIIEQLPADALMIDYDRQTHWAAYGLQSKVVLEAQVASEWNKVQQLLKGNNINVDAFVHDGIHNIDVMDDALDTLLGISHRFLRIANEFQHALELARPLRINREVRQQYDLVVLLAYRVQALSPGAFTQHFLESYNEDDTFFLYDIGKRRFVGTGEPLVEAVSRHLQAGRPNLANALRETFAFNSKSLNRRVFEAKHPTDDRRYHMNHQPND
jgi:hypothetical protein